jgi:hypothetical protein
MKRYFYFAALFLAAIVLLASTPKVFKKLKRIGIFTHFIGQKLRSKLGLN